MNEYSVNQVQTYQSKTVFVSSGAYNSDQTVSGSIRQLSRIQSVNWDIAYPLEQTTYLDSAEESYLSSYTPITIDIGFLHTNGRNEQYLGFIDTVGPSGALTFNLDQEKNLYVSIENTPGADAIGSAYAPAQTIMGFGQAVLTNYSMTVQQGQLVTSRAQMTCLNGVVYTGSSGNAVPAVNYQNGNQLTGQFALPAPTSQYDPSSTGYVDPIAALAIAPRDMYLTFPQGSPFGVIFSGAQACYLQGFDVSFNFPRRDLKPMGNVYPPNRAVFYPITVELNTTAIVNRYQRDQLDRINCLGTGQSLNVFVKQPCSSDVLFGLYFDRMQIVSQSAATSIGTNDTVSIQWRGLITSPYTCFFSPWVGSLVDLSTNSGWGGSW